MSVTASRSWSTDQCAYRCLKPTSGENRGMIINAIEQLKPEGSTNAEAGLRLGYRHAAQAYREGANNRVILCSDGVANVGNTDADASWIGPGYVDEGIYLTTIGVGMGNFNDVLLEQLADRGNGQLRLRGYAGGGARAVRGKPDFNLPGDRERCQSAGGLQPGRGERYRLLGYENRAIADQEFRDDSVDAGELGAGHTATALYAVDLKPGAEGRIATVQLRWKDPDTGEVREINGNFNTWDLAERFEDSDPHYQLAVTVAVRRDLAREPVRSASRSMSWPGGRGRWPACCLKTWTPRNLPTWSNRPHASGKHLTSNMSIKSGPHVAAFDTHVVSGHRW